MASAVEEMLRCAGPVQWTSRVAKQDMAWSGQTIKRGQWVNVCLAAANRDPARFPSPDVFDICREDNKHVAFGFGPHFCLGAALARMEAEIALATLLRRFPNLRLAEREPHWRSDFTFRAQTKLPVILR
jgi:cytochrome P450